MALVLSGIEDLEQHLEMRHSPPNTCRPSRCPDCGRGGLWLHGVYYRKSKGIVPTPIQRYLCPHCNSTCSSLPTHIPPRRWYLWITQQLAFQLMLTINDLQQTWKALSSLQDDVPSLCTIRRWWLQLHRQNHRYQFHLRNAFPELGYSTASFSEFWQACFAKMPLSQVMTILNRAGQSVP